MKEGWEDVLREQAKGVIPIRKRPFKRHKDAPMIVNTVSTVAILPKGYKLPLQAIANALGGCSQFEPSQFAADIIKLKTSTSDATILVFSSGKLVLTATTTEMHTKYMAHIYRLLIEKVECVMMDEVSKNIEIGTLAGKTVFENLQTHNMVGHGYLGVKVNLRALRNANPDSVKWLPEGFPAAKCCAWLTDDNMCHCHVGGEDPDVLKVVPKLLRKRCACTIKCLVFPTGRVVMTGGRNLQDINDVFYRMKRLAPHFEEGKSIDIFVVPKEKEYREQRPRNTLSQDEAIALLLESVHSFKPKKIKTKQIHTSNILLTFVEFGRLSNVKDTIDFMPEGGGGEEDIEEAIEKLSNMERTAEQTIILDYLKKKSKKRGEEEYGGVRPL